MSKNIKNKLEDIKRILKNELLKFITCINRWEDHKWKSLKVYNLWWMKYERKKNHVTIVIKN